MQELQAELSETETLETRLRASDRAHPPRDTCLFSPDMLSYRP